VSQKLTAKQALFVKEYLVDFNATQAAIRAGYSKKTASAIGHELMGKPHILAAICTEMENRNKRAEIDADYVLRRLVDIDQMDVIDIMEDDGSLKPVREWPKVWRQFIAGMDVAEMFEGGGKDLAVVGVLKKLKWPDKLKNLELLGKHINVQAFREQSSSELTGKDGAPLVPVLNVNVSGN